MPTPVITTKPGKKYRSLKRPRWLELLASNPPAVVIAALRDQLPPLGNFIRSPDMSPSNTANDPPDFIRINSEMRSEIRRQIASQVSTNDVTHLQFGETRMRIVTLPDDHISNVVALCTDKQVAWIDTRRGITGVADYRFASDRAIVQLEGNTVRVQNEPPTITNLSISSF